MRGYIVMQGVDHEGLNSPNEPLEVYLHKPDAEKVAERLNDGIVYAEVIELSLPSLTRMQRFVRLGPRVIGPQVVHEGTGWGTDA